MSFVKRKNLLWHSFSSGSNQYSFCQFSQCHLCWLWCPSKICDFWSKIIFCWILYFGVVCSNMEVISMPSYMQFCGKAIYTCGLYSTTAIFFYHLGIDAEASHSVDLKFEGISDTLDVGEIVVNLWYFLASFTTTECVHKLSASALRRGLIWLDAFVTLIFVAFFWSLNVFVHIDVDHQFDWRCLSILSLGDSFSGLSVFWLKDRFS